MGREMTKDKKAKAAITGISKKEYKKAQRAPCYLCKRFAGDKSFVHYFGEGKQERRIRMHFYKVKREKGELHYTLCDECIPLLENFSEFEHLGSVTFGEKDKK